MVDEPQAHEYRMVKPGLYEVRTLEAVRCRRTDCDASGHEERYRTYQSEAPTHVAPMIRHSIPLTENRS
jgi:hypothetical protein